MVSSDKWLTTWPMSCCSRSNSSKMRMHSCKSRTHLTLSYEYMKLRRSGMPWSPSWLRWKTYCSHGTSRSHSSKVWLMSCAPKRHITANHWTRTRTSSIHSSDTSNSKRQPTRRISLTLSCGNPCKSCSNSWSRWAMWWQLLMTHCPNVYKTMYWWWASDAHVDRLCDNQTGSVQLKVSTYSIIMCSSS